MNTIQDVIHESFAAFFNRDRKLREAIVSFSVEGEALKIAAKDKKICMTKIPRIGIFIVQTGIPIETIYVFSEDSPKIQEFTWFFVRSYLDFFPRLSEGRISKLSQRGLVLATEKFWSLRLNPRQA